MRSLPEAGSASRTREFIMQPLITTGTFAVRVAGTETARLRATADGQQWYLGSQWASGSPDTIELRRTNSVPGNARNWLRRAHAELQPFTRGEICTLEQTFPAYLRNSPSNLSFGVLDVSNLPAVAWMQLDPGVVTVWSPGYFGERPDIGYGCIEVRANGSRIESWVGLKGVTPQTSVRIERAWRGSSRVQIQARFRELTEGVELAYSSAMRSLPISYSSYATFRNAL